MLRLDRREELSPRGVISTDSDVTSKAGTGQSRMAMWNDAVYLGRSCWGSRDHQNACVTSTGTRPTIVKISIRGFTVHIYLEALTT